ncbi:MAG: AlpA family phage regulatory protein [Acetobacteraceae bacterium]
MSETPQLAKRPKCRPPVDLPDRCLRMPELQQLVPLSRMHIDRLEKDGKFPARIRLGPNAVAWKLSEILAWVETRRAGSIAST